MELGHSMLLGPAIQLLTITTIETVMDQIIPADPITILATIQTDGIDTGTGRGARGNGAIRTEIQIFPADKDTIAIGMLTTEITTTSG